MSLPSVTLHDPPVDPPRWTAALLQTRQTILPKRLVAPGPDADQLLSILGAAASAPDHGQLLPWRFVQVPTEQRARLAEVFAIALLERDGQATVEQVAQSREKAHRAPLLLLAIVDGTRGDPDIDLHERILSAGCAIQNMLLMATALGFGSALTSGKALKARALRTLFELMPGEHALCFISVGTAQSRKPTRLRPAVSDYVRTLSSAGTYFLDPIHSPFPWTDSTMNIASFDDLLNAARYQPLPQRLLFVFATVELPEDSSPQQHADFAAGHGGALMPLMCVDKSPQELDSFAVLAAEADLMEKKWVMVFAAALSGTVGNPPTSEDAEAPLQRMVEAVKSGHIDGYIPFDRQGLPVQLSQ